ncbi:MAG: hypothetical protein RMK52_09315 [Chitinophagales bacterium]|nr:hypothetical protein [Chitinophagales bacterium]MDW8394423.1 hypothetical protein [Chitinophagales bacterium]
MSGFFPKLISGKLMIVAGVAALALLFWACKDPCQGVRCVHGDCLDGACKCAPGYVGDSCSVEWKSLFFGTYNVYDICSLTGISLYTVNIKQDSTGLFKVLIANFANAFAGDVRATVSGNILTIPAQSPDNDHRTVSGSGTFYNQDSLSLSYRIVSTQGWENVCDQSYWKK